MAHMQRAQKKYMKNDMFIILNIFIQTYVTYYAHR